MASRLRTCAIAAALLASTAMIAEAQTHRLHLGPRVSYHFDAEEFGLGAQFSVPVADHLEFYPSFDYFFVDPGSLWALNADMKYRFAGQGLDWAYAGAGLGLANADPGGSVDGETDAGLNLLFGVESLKGWVHPFAEGRFVVADETGFQVSAGINFTLGR
ncbi:MAG: hypothetical protein ACREMH_06745 [Gemmatimonadales bacterium]